LLHRTCYGEDRLAPIEVSKRDLRLQCERELKSILYRLRAEYLAAAGEAEAMHRLLARSLGAFLPLFRALLSVQGHVPPTPRDAVIAQVAETLKLDLAPVRDVVKLRHDTETPTRDFLVGLFRGLYSLVDSMADKVDQLPMPESADK